MHKPNERCLIKEFNSQFPERGRKQLNVWCRCSGLSCSIPNSPKGDGNSLHELGTSPIPGSIPNSPKGDGNDKSANGKPSIPCSIPNSPKGDGNFSKFSEAILYALFNSQFPERGRKLVTDQLLVPMHEVFNSQFPERGRKRLAVKFRRGLGLWFNSQFPERGRKPFLPSTETSKSPLFNSQFPERGRKHGGVLLVTLFSGSSIPNSPKGDGNYRESRINGSNICSIPNSPKGDGNPNQGRRQKEEGRRV